MSHSPSISPAVERPSMAEGSLSVDDSGWIVEAEKIPSPNFDERPLSEVVDLLVIHGISLPAGKFGTPYVDQLFTNQLKGTEEVGFEQLKDLYVSSHLLIRRSGRLVQYVSLERRAWHAGVSSFHGREFCNDFSIGVELEGADEVPYTDAQYEQLSVVINYLRKIFPEITRQRIVGHSEIAPDRKSDPGPAFEWQRLFGMMEKKQ